MGKKRKRERNKCIAGTVSNWLSAMKAKASCHVNYSWCLAQRGGRGGLWKPLSSGKFAYVDSGIGERGGVLLYKINGMHNVANFLTNVLYFLFAAKKVISAEVSNKCVWSSRTVRFSECDPSHSVVPSPHHSHIRLEVHMGMRNPSGVSGRSSMQEQGFDHIRKVF